MGTGPCPRTDQLEALAASRKVSASVRKHAESCPLCMAILAELRENAQLLAELRAAAVEGPDEATRQRVLEICERLAADHPRRQRSRT